MRVRASRARWARVFLISVGLSFLAVRAAPPAHSTSAPQEDDTSAPVTLGTLEAAGRLVDLEFDLQERELMLAGVKRNLALIARLHAEDIENALFPATTFTPFVPGVERRSTPLAVDDRFRLTPGAPARPDDLDELAFWPIVELARLVRERRVSCVELAETFLARLERIDEDLHCVVSLTRERALEKARALDAELEQGHWRGPLHGIPYGAKDLFAVAGTRTTWGAESHRDQRLGYDAAVVRRLDDAGAVLIAKLSLGALAWGDVWFDGTTRNPWKLEQGSSGSSAGSASAVVAGGCAFTLGTETLGSIVSPSDRCGASSLRPTFGRVSRQGAMALSWTMDKVGPLCRSAQDAALVLEAIAGPTAPREADPSVLRDAGEFHAPGAGSVKGMRVGYAPASRRASPDLQRVLEELEGLGAELVEVSLPRALPGLEWLILTSEAAAAFDAFTREGLDDELVRQEEWAWPNAFRLARLLPAVEYLQAQRLRTRLCRDLDRALKGVDAFVHPSFGEGTLELTNLTGQPTFVAPVGFRADGTPRSISFTGQLLGEERLLALVIAWQAVTNHHLSRPPGF